LSLYITFSENRDRQWSLKFIICKCWGHSFKHVSLRVRLCHILEQNANAQKNCIQIYTRGYCVLHKQMFSSNDANIIIVCISPCNLQILIKNRHPSRIWHIIMHNLFVVNVLEGAMSVKYSVGRPRLQYLNPVAVT